MARFLFARFSCSSPSILGLPPMLPTSLLKKPILSSIGSIVEGATTNPRSTTTIEGTTIRFPFSLARPTLATVQFHSSLPNRRQLHHSVAPDSRPNSWDPLKVACIADEILSHPECQHGNLACSCVKHHWLVLMHTDCIDIDTEEALFDHYVKTLAMTIGVSEEEAKSKIYLVSYGWQFGFGAKMDEDSKYKLEVCQGVASVLEDYNYDSRNKNPAISLNHPKFRSRIIYDELVEDFEYSEDSESFEDSTDFKDSESFEDSTDFKDSERCENATDSGDVEISKDAEISKNFELSKFEVSEDGIEEPVSENQTIIGGHVSSGCQHCFIIMEPVGVTSTQQKIDCYIRTLAHVLGSEQEAKQKIYRIAHHEDLLGFGAEIDADTRNKLKAMPGVREVLPEYFLGKDHKDEFNVLCLQILEKLRLDLRQWRVEPDLLCAE